MAMLQILRAHASLVLVGAAVSIGGAGKQDEPHFITGADSFLRASSSRVGQNVARILSVQSGLDEMRHELSGEYELWQHKKKMVADEKERLQNETAQLLEQLREQKSLGQEKLRLQSQLAFHKSETKKAADALTDKQLHWKPQQEALKKDIALIEEQMKSDQARKLEQLSAAEKKTGEIQDRNKALQTEIFTLNNEVGSMQREFANRTILNKQRHSGLLSEVESLQSKIHSLQDKVVARAQVHLEVQRHWQRLSAQASEVVQQKEELQKTRAQCEKELQDLDGLIHDAQHSLKESNQKMAECQRLDAEAQGLQGKLNECRAQSQAGRAS